jgi:hypothetical protein
VRTAVGNKSHVGNQSGGENGGGFLGNGAFGVLANLYSLRAHAGFLSLCQVKPGMDIV